MGKEMIAVCGCLYCLSFQLDFHVDGFKTQGLKTCFVVPFAMGDAHR